MPANPGISRRLFNYAVVTERLRQARWSRQQIVAGAPRLRVLQHVFILSGCRDSRGHLNSIVGSHRIFGLTTQLE